MYFTAMHLSRYFVVILFLFTPTSCRDVTVSLGQSGGASTATRKYKKPATVVTLCAA